MSLPVRRLARLAALAASVLLPSIAAQGVAAPAPLGAGEPAWLAIEGCESEGPRSDCGCLSSV